MAFNIKEFWRPKEFWGVDGKYKELARTYGAEEVILREGDTSREMYIIQEGEVRVTKMIAGKETELGTMGKGDFFGEMALLEDEVRSAAALAKDHSRLLGFFRPDLEALIEINPSLGNKILQNLSKVVCTRLRKTNELLMENQLNMKKNHE